MTDSADARCAGPTGPSLCLPAYAKLNLSLAVGPRQPDGYHLLDSLMVPLDLHDTVTLRERPGGGGVELRVSGPTAAGTPADRSNLVCKAAERIAARLGRSPDVLIELEKRIPVQGGLGGGSADAAATLVGLNRLWSGGLDRAGLIELAAALGSDVPFCVVGEPARVSGRGEVVRPLSELGEGPLERLWALLVFPGLSVATGAAYGCLDGLRDSQTIITTRFHEVGRLKLSNDLEAAAFQVEPALGRLFQRLVQTGLARLMVAGSGATLFAIFDNPEEPTRWAGRIKACEGVEAAVAAVRTRST